MLLSSWNRVDSLQEFTGASINIYTDGSVIASNPSPYGGSYGFVGVDENDLGVFEGYGYIRPDFLYKDDRSREENQVDLITSNVMELLAVYYGLYTVRYLPEHVRISIYTDSTLNLRWWKSENRDMTVFPSCIYQMRDAISSIVDRTEFKLIAGHPSKKDLVKGHKDGVPVSVWNKRADELASLSYRSLWKNQEVLE